MQETAERTRAIPVSGVSAAAGRLKRFVFSFRPEEFIALVAFFPMAYLTFKAYFFFKAQGSVPKLFVGDVQRLVVVVVIIIIAYLIARYRSSWSFVRDILPFTYALAIYTNLHDTVHFANPHDIHDSLIAIDQWLFGMQPSVWSQRFVAPWLTEIFSFCYMIYFLFIPIVALVLLVQRRKFEFREVVVTAVLCYYLGYVLYIIFPAAPPRHVLGHLYTVKLDGTIMTGAVNSMLSVLPSKSRCAFPSLHAAITLLSLIFSWKYARPTFWLLLPFSVGLHLSTVYLRHHYVVDLLAGWVVAVIAFIYVPRFDRWWQEKMRTFSPRNAIRP